LELVKFDTGQPGVPKHRPALKLYIYTLVSQSGNALLCCLARNIEQQL